MGALSVGTRVLLVEDGVLLSATITEKMTLANGYWLELDTPRTDGSTLAAKGRSELVALA